MGRKMQYQVELSDEQVRELKKTIRSKNTSLTIMRRCQILLDLDIAHGNSMTREQCAKSNGVSGGTVTKTVGKYAAGGLEEALSYKRSINSDHARRKVDGRVEAQIIALATEPPPEGHARWTLRLLEEKGRIVLEVPVGKNAISRALKKRSKAAQK